MIRLPSQRASSTKLSCTRRASLAGLTALLLGAALGAQDLDVQVRELLQRADRGPLDQVWQVGRQISALGAKEEPLATAIGRQLEQAKEQGRLAAAVALQELADGTQFGKEIYSALEPLLKAQKPETAIAALRLAQRDSFFNARTREQLRGLIKPSVESDLTEAKLRAAAATTLWRIGTTEEQRLARKVLLDFVGSTNRHMQVLGALGLAEMNAEPNSPAWPVLREISDEPTPEGRLAWAYLRIENQRREFDAAIMNRLNSDAPGAPAPAGKDPAVKDPNAKDPNAKDPNAKDPNAKDPAGKDPAAKAAEPGRRDGEFAMLEEILARVAQRHVRGDRLSRDKLLQEAARGLLRSLDRHSTFLTSDEYQKFYFDLNPEYGGIGAFVNFDRDDVFSIVRPIYSGPAYAAALRSGDKILEVDGWETDKHTSDEIISRLKGKPGTKVEIKVFRRGWDEPRVFSIVRRKIQVPSVNHELLPGDIGYVEIITFGGRTGDELRQALTTLRERGAKGLVLDLRNNTGGYLEIATEVVSQFVEGEKLVVYTQGRQAPRLEYKTDGRALLPKMPMAVLINGYSASASEITAGALQDHGRAVVVGERSYGKGSVQTLLPLMTDRPENYKDTNGNGQFDPWEPYEDRNDNGKYDIGPRLKLTVAHYFLPSGRCVHKQRDETGKVLDPDWGVVPDRALPMLETSVRDRWKESVLYDLLEKDVFSKYVEKHINDNRALFVTLAEGDEGSVARYPGFEEFYKSLDTNLDRDTVRRWIRYSVREKVSDLRSKAFPGSRALGDFQEDSQLQEALRVVLDKLGRDLRTIDAYKNLLKIEFPADQGAARTDKK